MALQFITGDLKVNKKRVIIERIAEIKATNPDAIIYYLVPEHLKFDMESFMLETMQQLYHTKQAAMIDIQVVSFSRLAWFMLNPSIATQPNLSKVGLSMIVRQLLAAETDQLKVYRGQIHHQGFIEQLVDLFEELYEGNILPNDITSDDSNSVGFFEPNQASENSSATTEILHIEHQRLVELKLLYHLFLEAVNGRSLANYQSYDILSHYLTQQGSMPNHYIIIDHHYYLNAQQTSLLLDLAKTFQQVWMTLPLTHAEARGNQWEPLVQTQRDTYQQIKQLCGALKLPVLADWDVTGPDYDFDPAISVMAQQFKTNLAHVAPRSLTQAEMVEFQSTHHFAEFDTPQTELRHVSNQIHALVTQEGYRYQDFLVVARDMDRYQPLVQPLFSMNDIPVFFDHEASMMQHPFMLWVEGVLNLKRYNWQYDDLMLVLKSELFVPFYEQSDTQSDRVQHRQFFAEQQHKMHHLENILLANGFFGYRFYQSTFEWHFDQADFEYADFTGRVTGQTLGEVVQPLREWIISHLYQPLVKWQADKTGEEAATWLYQLVERAGIRQQMVHLRDEAIERGEIEASRRHEQIWQVFSDALDEFYSLYAEETIDFETFSEILLVGLKEGTYHIIPPTLDEVTFTNMVSPQVQPYKVAFILGADEVSLPRKFEQNSLLTLENRQAISNQLLPSQFLMDHVQQHNQQEVLLAYQLLLSASEKLYLSYAINIGQQSVKMSPYFEQLITQFQLPLKTYTSLLDVSVPQTLAKSHFGRFDMQVTPVLQRIRHYYETQTPVSQELIQLIQSMLHYETIYNEQLGRTRVLGTRRRSLEDLMTAMFKFNQLPQNIRSETALKLYGAQLNLSVSKIEQYYQDPYSHFLIHGLKLQERQLYEVNPAKTGDYFHEMLDRFIAQTLTTQTQLTALSDQAFEQLYRETIKQMGEDERFNLFTSHPRYLAIKNQMNRKLYDFLRFSQRQQLLTRVNTLKTEAIFGLNPSGEHLNGFIYPLSAGGQLSISGKIDRIDEIQTDRQNLLQIIDYKSGNKKFDLVDAYYGLDLQILTYLTVALKHYPTHQPVGAFYQPILQGYQTASNEHLVSDNASELIESEQLLQNKLRGFITVDPETLREIEPLAEELGKSQIYPVNFTKSGFSKSSSVFNSDELSILLKYTHYLFKQAAEQIQAGHIEMQPFKQELYTPSMQSIYRVITGFDATQTYSAYRHKTIKKGDVLKEMEHLVNEKEVDDDDED